MTILCYNWPMIERKSAIAFTSNRTYILGDLRIKNNKPIFLFVAEEYPHLKNIDPSYIQKITIEHEYGEIYEAEQVRTQVIFEPTRPRTGSGEEYDSRKKYPLPKTEIPRQN